MNGWPLGPKSIKGFVSLLNDKGFDVDIVEVPGWKTSSNWGFLNLSTKRITNDIIYKLNRSEKQYSAMIGYSYGGIFLRWVLGDEKLNLSYKPNLVLIASNNGGDSPIFIKMIAYSLIPIISLLGNTELVRKLIKRLLDRVDVQGVGFLKWLTNRERRDLSIKHALIHALILLGEVKFNNYTSNIDELSIVIAEEDEDFINEAMRKESQKYDCRIEEIKGVGHGFLKSEPEKIFKVIKDRLKLD